MGENPGVAREAEGAPLTKTFGLPWPFGSDGSTASGAANRQIERHDLLPRAFGGGYGR